MYSNNSGCAAPVTSWAIATALSVHMYAHVHGGEKKKTMCTAFLFFFRLFSDIAFKSFFFCMCCSLFFFALVVADLIAVPFFLRALSILHTPFVDEARFARRRRATVIISFSFFIFAIADCVTSAKSYTVASLFKKKKGLFSICVYAFLRSKKKKVLNCSFFFFLLL